MRGVKLPFVFVTLTAVGACVEVPDSVRKEFSAPSASERSNFRRGRHGTALPTNEAVTPKAVAGQGDASALAADSTESFDALNQRGSGGMAVDAGSAREMP